MAKVLVATEKPFSPDAVEAMRQEAATAGFGFLLLEKYTDAHSLQQAVRDADALIIRSDKVDEDVLAAAGQLKIVVRAGAGYDNIDLAAASAKGICVMNTPGQNANAVAELVFGMLIYALRNFYAGTAGTELKGKKLGILAYGNVGRHVARLAQGFDMQVYAYDAFCPSEVIARDHVQPLASAGELFRTCPIVSLHIPVTGETKRCINYDLLSLLPQGAILVNTARKEVICEPCLARIFAERPDFRYLSDIRPDIHADLAASYPDRYFSTPKKMGAQTAEANFNAGVAAMQQVIAFLTTGDETFRVNKPNK
ncbi:MAG: 3-phosphoglycerate dehydrogenase [Tannerellaceae bacterium]|jgi:D-3-phosphoglycerate dehydrogenase|nr:3-phosphoglycerate dehydrogenase [Tannerellaceae bacterium]